MAVGRMPQAVESYIDTNNFEIVDKVKREILELYYDDLKKVDSSGRITDMFKAVPSQLASKKKHYVITAAKCCGADDKVFWKRFVLPYMA